MNTTPTAQKKSGSAGRGDRADPLWFSIQPSPNRDGDRNDDLERIMWGADGLPPPSSSASDEDDDEDDDDDERITEDAPPSSLSPSLDQHAYAGDARDKQEITGAAFVSNGVETEADADARAEAEAGNDDKSPTAGAAGADGPTIDETNCGVSLSCIAWKKRSGLGAFSQGYVRKPWERRRLVIVGTKILYYSTFEEEEVEDSIKLRPRAILDLVDEKCSVEVIDPASDGAPTPFEVDIVSEDKETRWKFCFDTPESLMDLLDVAQSILNDAGIGTCKGRPGHSDDPESFRHNFEAGDHIYRWEMIIFPPVIYPIQIHGIVLEAGKNCVIVADFGMTGYGKKEGSSFKHADEADDHDLQDSMQAAWRKFRPNEDQRLNIVTMTDPKEIHKWFKASYGAGGLLSHKKKKPKKRMMGKLSSVFKASPDSEHLERRALSASVRARANTADGASDGATDSPNKSKTAMTKSTVPDTSQITGTDTNSNGATDVPDWFGDNNTASEHEPSVFSISKKDHADPDLPKSDPREIVLARANFLLEHGEEVLPPYHVFYSNSECIAVWCKTGRWSTLQTAVFLATNSVGGAKSSTLFTIGIAAAHAVLVPLAVVGGLIWVSAPMVILKKSKEKWEEATLQLTDLFWSSAPPEVFVSAIEQWSDLQEEEDAVE